MKNSILRIKETCLYVSDLNKSAYFYHDLMGFDIINQHEGRHIFFRAGASVLLCFIAEATKNDTILPPHYGYGQNHLAFEVSPVEYEKMKSEIISKGIKITHEHQWERGLRSFYFDDPDGHVLEIAQEGIWG